MGKVYSWFTKCKAYWKPLPDLTPYPFGVHAPPPIIRGVFYGYDGLGRNLFGRSISSTAGNALTFNRPREHGISMFRGTNTIVVDWPDGKFLELQSALRGSTACARREMGVIPLPTLESAFNFVW